MTDQQRTTDLFSMWQMNASLQFCPNLACSARGQVGQGNIVVHGRNRPRYKCKTCGRTFSAKAGTALEGLRKPTELIVIVMTFETITTGACDLRSRTIPRQYSSRMSTLEVTRTFATVSP